MATGKQKKSKKKAKSEPEAHQLSLLDIIIEEQQKGGGIVTAMLSMKPPSEVWRGTLATPPGSIIENILSEFETKTNIPLELPFFAFFHFLSGRLLHDNINLELRMPNCDPITVQPDIWTVILAPSSSGKTWTVTKIQEGIPEIAETNFRMEGIASTARFVEDLQEHNRKLFIRDEFNELYKQLNGNISGPLAELKDLFLRLYSNDTISRKRRDDETIIENAAISFLGMTVTQSFTSALTADDLINGFAQRFSFIIAHKDPKKHFKDYPIYGLNTSGWNAQWKELMDSIKYKTYIADARAIEAFKTAFSLLANQEIDESFYRRQMWKAHKYALIYHILLGKGDQERIGPDCYGWAARMIHLLLQDCLDLLREHGYSEIESKVQKVEALQERMAQEGKTMTLREIVRRIRAIKTISEAKAILHIIDRKVTHLGGENPSFT